MNDWDVIIVGQGLAGTTLAWNLNWRGARVLLIDRDEDFTSSKIAAGLITPITGQRLVKTWRFDELWNSAKSFYAKVEQLTATPFFRLTSQVRLFANEKEQSRFAERKFDGDEIEQPVPLIDSHSFHNLLGGFQMNQSAQLNVSDFLTVSRTYFEKDNAWLKANVRASDISIQSGGIVLAKHRLTAKRLIFCQGFGQSKQSVWFPLVDFDATRGEILTIKVPNLAETRIVNRGVWLAPLGDGLFRVGSTYDWDDLTSGPTQAGRASIVKRLAEFLRLPFEVVDHHATVRPIVVGRHPIVGLHHEHHQLGIFNGLGSKGSLQAPHMAEQFAEHLLNGRPLDDEINVCRRFPEVSEPIRKPNPRLTELAHQGVQAVLKPGELAVDATAGNGHDTLFLATCVGPQGRVVAIDLQSEAIQRTRDRIDESGFKNVLYFESSHINLPSIVAEEDHRSVGAVMFNLGYLPSGDKSVITQTSTTILSIRAALNIIRPGGIVSVLAYPGHSGGDAEASAVVKFAGSLDSEKYRVTVTQANNAAHSPVLVQVVELDAEIT